MAGGVNKMFIMIPVMLAARKLDGDNEDQIYWLRIAYGTIQSICVMLVFYTYLMATSTATSTGGDKIVYIPPAPTPFTDPNMKKKKYTETKYSAHVLTTARSLLGSTLFGIALTCGLHYYRGMLTGLAIQTIMAPLNLFENPLVKAILFGRGFNLDDKIFDEKSLEELTSDDEVVDEGGNVIVPSKDGNNNKLKNKSNTNTNNNTKRTFEEILLDTWDAGSEADIGTLLSSINETNCNYKIKDNGWTPIMILAGIGADGSGEAIKDVMDIGGNPAITDDEGWNALHWAAFHGSPEGINALKDNKTLFTVKDKDNKMPLNLAKEEKNDSVIKIMEQLMSKEDLAAAAEAGSSTNNEGKKDK